MEVKNAKALVNGSTVLGDLKRKRAVRCAAHFIDAAQAMISRSNPNQPAIKRRKILGSDGCGDNGTGCFGKPLLTNYENIKKSGLPQRLLFYQNGEWNDFPAGILDLIREAFQSEKLMIEIMFKGNLVMLDFLRMVQIDLEIGLQLPIAWIDESDKYFFPELSSHMDERHGGFGFNGSKDQAFESCGPNGTREIKVYLEIGISRKDSSNIEDCDEVSNSNVNRMEVQEKIYGNYNEMEQDCSSQKKPYAEIEGKIVQSCPREIAIGESKLLSEFGELDKLATGGSDYNDVQKLFLSGMSPFEHIDIIGIYRCPLTTTSLQPRHQAFQKLVQITEKFRGDANVRHAWYGSSREAVMRIMLHGFGINEKSNHSPSCGAGIYLTPENYPLNSANYFDVDENGIQHMLLCRVIMGKMELVRPGSEQFHPSSEEFDSGVDDIENPKRYIIWNMHRSTHIYPECVISFKVPSSVKANWSERTPYQCKSNESVITKLSQGKDQGFDSSAPRKPTSAWMTLPMLFDSISSKIPAEALSLINRHYREFKDKKISRDDLIKKLRYIVGDQLLKSTLESFQHKNVSLFEDQPLHRLYSWFSWISLFTALICLSDKLSTGLTKQDDSTKMLKSWCQVGKNHNC